jgi:hypothetical protein
MAFGLEADVLAFRINGSTRVPGRSPNPDGLVRSSTGRPSFLLASQNVIFDTIAAAISVNQISSSLATICRAPRRLWSCLSKRSVFSIVVEREVAKSPGLHLRFGHQALAPTTYGIKLKTKRVTIGTNQRKQASCRMNVTINP